MLKRCKKCNELKPIENFSISASNTDGHSYTCKPCVAIRNKEYWRTPDGRISQIFAVQNVNSKQRGHPKPTYTREELTAWAYSNGLLELWEIWHNTGFPKESTPSIDRKNPYKGYSLDNIRLVTWETNNEKAYEDRKSCKHITKQNKKVEQLSLDGIHIAFHESIANAARITGAVRSNINAMCKGKPQLKSVGGFLWRYPLT